MSTHTSNGRAWGYLGVVLGGLVSVGANIAHSYLAPAGASMSWRPPAGAVIGAEFWPIALFVALEILARTSWPSRKRWIVVRFLGLVPVAVVAAVVSYEHLSGLLAHYGEDQLTVRFGPLAVDGLMIMSSAAVMATTPQRAEPAKPVLPSVLEPVPAKEHPKPRTRATRKTTRKRAPVQRTWAELLAAVGTLNAETLESTGKPASLRQIKIRLRVGQDTAVRLRQAVTVPAAAPESPGSPADTIIELVDSREAAAEVCAENVR